MRPSACLSTALLLAATSSAWPSIFRHPVDAVKRELAPLLAERQDEATSKTSFNLSFSASSTADEDASATPTDNADSSTTNDADSSATPTTTDDSNSSATPTDDSTSDRSSGTARETGSSGSETSTGKSTGKATDSAKSSGTGKTTKKATSTTSESFDPRLPAGGVSMVTPNALSPASYYKIHDYITFAWNYTSLSKAPSYIDVLATCTANAATYTIALNQTFESMQAVTWDTGAYQATGTVPLLTETYTLIIHDAQKAVSATAAAGYLGTWSQFTFGMYSPQPYTPIADYVCATCNSAVSSMEKQTYAFLLATVGVTVLSFGWFAGVAGLC